MAGSTPFGGIGRLILHVFVKSYIHGLCFFLYNCWGIMDEPSFRQSSGHCRLLQRNIIRIVLFDNKVDAPENHVSTLVFFVVLAHVRFLPAALNGPAKVAGAVGLVHALGYTPEDSALE